jgi:hypothetical protein
MKMTSLAIGKVPPMLIFFGQSPKMWELPYYTLCWRDAEPGKAVSAQPAEWALNGSGIRLRCKENKRA